MLPFLASFRMFSGELQTKRVWDDDEWASKDDGITSPQAGSNNSCISTTLTGVNDARPLALMRHAGFQCLVACTVFFHAALSRGALGSVRDDDGIPSTRLQLLRTSGSAILAS